MVVRIAFNLLATETCCDHVGIYDGDSDSSITIVQLSGTDVDLSGMIFSSTQQYMYIYFTADSSVVSHGFSATFQSIRKQIVILNYRIGALSCRARENSHIIIQSH